MVVIKRSKTYLEHHGVKGQKWGIRNGPPYPIKEHSKARASSASMALRKLGSLFIDDEIVRNLAMLGLGVGVGVVGTVTITKMNPEQLRLASENALENYLSEYNENREIFSLDSAPRIKGQYGLDQVDNYMQVVNSIEGRLGHFNCLFCVSAMAMRVKGYDVVANGASDSLSPTLITDFFEGAKYSNLNANSGRNVFDNLLKEGEGSYGSLALYPKDVSLSGHNLFWMVKDGKTRILDPQTKKEYIADTLKNVGMDISQSVFTNLTNCEPTEFVLGGLKTRKE